MLRSMTAYGRSNLTKDTGDMVCEIRSVNHRYLDVTVRIPEALRSLEADFRERLSTRMRRGKVEVSLKLNELVPSPGALSINEPLLRQLSLALNRVSEITGSAQSSDPLTLLQWPGVLIMDSQSQNALAESALSVFEIALEDLVATREREGTQIADLLERKSHAMAELVEQVRSARPSVVTHQRERLVAKLATLDIDNDSLRLEQELVFAAQRLDIDEELDRLDVHIVELNKILQRTDPVGRRLDFLMQEFNREANTLSSKANDSRTTAAGIDMKVIIEQMREQVQNVE